MIYYVHHLNDLSGSPLILLNRLKHEAEPNSAILVTNQSHGFLSDWQGAAKTFSYIKHKIKILRFASLSIWYLRVTLYLLVSLKKGDKVVISTLISSPLLIVPILKESVMCELMVNEVFFRVPLWRNLGLKCANSAKVKKSYLSKFVRDSWGFNGPSTIKYPKLREELVALATSKNRKPFDVKALNFFLVGSLIEAKGYKLFIQLARHFENNSHHSFKLYLNGNPESFEQEFPKHALPNNLQIEFNNSSPEIFADHDIFLGLTNPSLWVETFGQTFAEAMIFANIVVIPPVGAQLEYIKDGLTGFVFDEFSMNGVLTQIERIQNHEDLFQLALETQSSMSKFNASN